VCAGGASASHHRRQPELCESLRRSMAPRTARLTTLLTHRLFSTGGATQSFSYRPQVPAGLPSLPGVAWAGESTVFVNARASRTMRPTPPCTPQRVAQKGGCRRLQRCFRRTDGWRRGSSNTSATKQLA
jgi:hypothetical protein